MIQNLAHREGNYPSEGNYFMKRILTLAMVSAAAAAFALAGPVQAEGKYGMAGCGLGSIVLGPGGGIMQIFAATTNGTAGNQTFGITSGTSNCVEDAAAYREKQQEVFVTVHFQSLQQEMAAGQGEKLDAFASLLGCPSNDLGAMTQDRHDAIFDSKATPSTVLASIKTEVSGNATLASACSI